jgi:hypothetical protein
LEASAKEDQLSTINQRGLPREAEGLLRYRPSIARQVKLFLYYFQVASPLPRYKLQTTNQAAIELKSNPRLS